MAPKKTNKLPTGERPKQLSGLAYRTARDVGSASEGAAIAGRNRDFAKKEAAKAAAKKASYSPAPMSAAAKKKAAAAGKATSAKVKNPQGLKKVNLDKPKRGPKAGSSVVSKVVKRAKTVAREVRDVKTAVGTSLRDQEQNVRRAAMGVKPSGKNVGKNLRTQIKEVGSAIKSGKKGTSSDMYSKPGAYKSGTKRK
jgi:hypothetical protein